MLNAELRIRCISKEALQAIVDILREESNAIFIDCWTTKEDPRTGVKASVTQRPTGTGLGTATSDRRNRTAAARRTGT